MYKITSIESYPRQELNLIVGNNEICKFYLYFCPRQYSWYFDWEYNDIVSNGNKVVLTPNALRQFKDRIPFGIAFMSEDKIPPFKLDDFVNRISVYTLDQEEVEEVEQEIFSPNV